MNFGQAVGDLLQDAYVMRAKIEGEIIDLHCALNAWSHIEKLLEAVEIMEHEESWEYAE